MAWFKVDDRLYAHPKWLRLKPASRALWVTAGSWCSGHLMDGFVPVEVLPMLGGNQRAAMELVEADLWVIDGPGFRFHDWTAYQPSREDVERRRERSAERIRRWREERGREATA